MTVVEATSQLSSEAMIPEVIKLPFQTPVVVASYFAQEKGVVLLHSVKGHETLARYSFLGVRPYETLVSRNGWIKKNNDTFHGCIFTELQQSLNQVKLKRHPNLPPFQGGGMGYFAYDLNRQLEKLPQPKQDDMVLPDCIFAFYDLVFAWDHKEEALYLFSSGLPYNGKERFLHARKRQAEILSVIEQPPSYVPGNVIRQSEIVSNFIKEDYIKAIEQAIEYIYAGDIFEVNISQRFKAQVQAQPFDLYYQLHQKNPAPFSGFLNFNACQLISSSPERFLKLQDRQIEACPIKGTRPRSEDAALDEQYKKELIESEKDRAENIMIVDLMRNDISRVCLPHSVKVPVLCGLQSFATVHHLVSTVRATLAPEYDAIDLLKASFPGGSITGAPKIRSMEIIAEMEPTARGAYCGSMGYIGFDGNMDLSILIRTYTMKRDTVTFQAGGAITAQSDAASEYQETLDKASALIKVLGG